MLVNPSAAGCDTPVGSDSLEARSKDGTLSAKPGPRFFRVRETELPNGDDDR